MHLLPIYKLRRRQRLQISGSAGLLRRSVNPVLHLRRMDEVRPEVRNVLEKLCFQPKTNMVEENQMLMDLAHIADMRHDWKLEDFGKKADGQELADTSNSRAINLDERERLRFHEVLELDSICNVLSGGDFNRRKRSRQLHV